MLTNHNSLILSAAKRAFSTTQFYESLYQKVPKDIEAVPHIRASFFHQCNGLLDCIVDRELVCGTLPPFLRHGQEYPLTITESEKEMDLRHRRITNSVNSILEIGKNDRCNFLILSDELTGPYCGEILSSLAWEHHHASVCYWFNEEQLINDLDSFKPDCLIIASPLVPISGVILNKVKCIQIQHISNMSNWNANIDALLVSDEFSVFAHRKLSQQKYQYLSESILIENDPISNFASITTHNFDCHPFIRYTVNVCANELEPYL